MKTVNCMLRREPDRTAGDKVIDLTAWKAEHAAELDGPETARARPQRRRRTHRPRAMDWAELAATLAVTAAFLALIARVLLF